MPGVTYERGVQFTPHGPVALHIVTGPRPTGLYALRPVLSNEAIQGRERVTAMQKRLSSTATMVGVNGDLFALGDGPAERRPHARRRRREPAVRRPLERRRHGRGPLDVRRVEFFGTWRGLGQRRTVNDMNQPPGDERRLALHAELRAVDAVAARHRRRRDRAVPAGDAEHRPLRAGRRAHERRADGDPARRRRARRARHGGAAAARGGAGRHGAHAARHPAPRLDRHRAGDRRRPGPRPERQARLPLERGVHVPRSSCRATRARPSDSSRTAASSSSPPTAASRATASG